MVHKTCHYKVFDSDYQDVCVAQNVVESCQEGIILKK